MLLQELQIPDKESFESDLRNMYIRCGSDRIKYSDGGLLCAENGELIFNTYYNSFSFNKWLKYTSIDNLFLSVRIKGDFELIILKLELMGGEASETKISSKILRGCNDRIPRNVKAEMPFDEEFNGSYAFILRALKDSCGFYGGYYGCEAEEELLNPVDLAIGICHYKREEYVAENLKRLESFVFGSKRSELKEHLKIFVSDNSGTLEDYLKNSGNDNGFRDICEDPRVKILKNKNLGGAGGFSGAIYAASHSDGDSFTHMILMDDDVVFTHFAIERLYIFLRFLKPEYAGKSVIGGAMLLADCPFMQYGNGETWSVSGMVFNKTNYNLYVVRDILRNEVEENTNQLPWWFYCFPFNERTKDMYALPLFFQYDDIDFNQRFKDLKQITLNGISLLHESFENKYSLSKEYYAIRNRLIICSIHGGEDFNRDFMKNLIRDAVKTNILIYRYKAAELAIRAFKDFFRGLDWLSKQDPESLNREVSESVYKLENVDEKEIPYLDEQYNLSLVYDETPRQRTVRRLLLNGALIPSKCETVVPMIHYKVIKSKLYRVKTAVNYDPKTHKKFITKRNNASAVKVLLEYMGVINEINGKFDKTAADYRNKYKEYITGEFWKEYLGL